MRIASATYFRQLQSEICQALEQLDGRASFCTDCWERQDAGGGHGGGGVTRVLSDGGVFERAGVNFSEVEGTLPLEMSRSLVGAEQAAPFYATGISLVLHPRSPFVPTTHANFRYLEVSAQKWFGGGSDLTPYYLFEEDAAHFHRVLKAACDRNRPGWYEDFKRQCDEYFYLPHRGETRGVGGVFFDYLGKGDPELLPSGESLVRDLGSSLLESYVPIVERRMSLPWSEAERRFQLLRRGRYVEFNLIYDRGTQFGLRTGGRAESILMSLPPEVHWTYDYEPEPHTREAELLEVLRNPREWV